MKLDDVQIHIPAGPRLGDVVVEAEGAAQGLRRRAADRGPVVHAAAGGHRRRDRPERRRQDDAVPHDLGRGAARRRRAARSATRSSSPTSTSRATRSTRTRPSGRRSPAATTSIKVGEREMNSRAYVAGFNFKGSDQQQQGRHALRRRAQPRCTSRSCCARGGNLLLLDEPTNDLDVDTLRALEEALLAFAGCAVVSPTTAGSSTASPRTCSPSRATPRSSWFEGNFEAYEEHRRERLGAEADQPHRITLQEADAQLAPGYRPGSPWMPPPGCRPTASADFTRRRQGSGGYLATAIFMREPLGPAGGNSSPRSPARSKASHALRHDLRHFCGDFLSGTGSQYFRCWEAVREDSQRTGLQRLARVEEQLKGD